MRERSSPPPALWRIICRWPGARWSWPMSSCCRKDTLSPSPIRAILSAGWRAVPHQNGRRRGKRTAEDAAAGARGPKRRRRDCFPKNGKEASTSIFPPNAIDMSRFPFGTWRKITRDILSGDRTELFALGEPRGDAALRETVCRYLHAVPGGERLSGADHRGSGERLPAPAPAVYSGQRHHGRL